MTRMEQQARPQVSDDAPRERDARYLRRFVSDHDYVLFSADNCSIERTLAVVGEKWTFLVLREAFNGIRRFADLQANTGAPRQVLSARLNRLVEENLLRKHPYQEPGQRQRDEYRLTQKGLDLYPIMMALMHWGDKYVADPEGPAVVITHRGCGAPVEQRFVCADGHEIAGPREVTATPGPGARMPENEAPVPLPTLERCTGSS